MTLKYFALAGSLFVAATAFAASSGSQRPSSAEEFAPLSTPKGITIQSLGKYHGYGMDSITAALSGRGEMAYADAKGMTLYTYAKDPLGKSVCVGDCTKDWKSAPVLDGAEEVGFWTIIRRDDGTRQWALRGKPVYTYVKDIDMGSVGGNSPKRFGRGPHISERGRLMIPIQPDVPLPEDWTAVKHFPFELEGVPADFQVKNVLDAMGLALLNESGRTLYVFTGVLGQEKSVCKSPCPWQPLPAAQLAAANGNFVPVDRNDGVRQWTYKGLGLYSYDGDLAPGDANGGKIDSNWHVAYIARNFMPPRVTIQYAERIGKVLANAQGQTLYRRDSYIFQSGSGHGQRRGVLIRAAVGRDLAANPRCIKECEKWDPFLAPDDAVVQGDWSVYTRSDGKKQWAYVGYALWTYDGDKEPGDVMADGDWQDYISLTERTDHPVDIGTQYDTVASLYWAAMPP